MLSKSLSLDGVESIYVQTLMEEGRHEGEGCHGEEQEDRDGEECGDGSGRGGEGGDGGKGEG